MTDDIPPRTPSQEAAYKIYLETIAKHDADIERRKVERKRAEQARVDAAFNDGLEAAEAVLEAKGYHEECLIRADLRALKRGA